MKEIKAIIQPHRLSAVIEALQQMEGLPGVTVSEVKGFGRNRGKSAESRAEEPFVEYVRKTKIEIVVPDQIVDEVVRTIVERGSTGHPGDGLIFISDVEKVVRIRTGATEEYSG